jgi:small subunit ribosomal protein S17
MTSGTGLYGGRKVREGTVVSDKMEKTVIVAIQWNIRHRLYKKTIRRAKKFLAHDENEQAKVGDRVRIVEAAPVSLRKRWQVVEVLRKAELPEVAPESIDLELLGEVTPEAEAVDETAPAAAVAEPEAVASPEAEAAQPPEVEISEPEPVEEAEPVLASAAEEAVDVPAQAADSAEAAEPEIPAAEEADIVQADAAPEATQLETTEDAAVDTDTGETTDEPGTDEEAK